MELNGISSFKEDQELLLNIRHGKIKQGYTTGFEELDVHYLFKPMQLEFANGFNGVGKTTGQIFLFCCGNVLHKFKYIIWSSENDSADIRINIMQFLKGKLFSQMSDSEISEVNKYIDDNFIIIKPFYSKDKENLESSILDVLRQAYDIVKHFRGKWKVENPFFNTLIDPYNSLTPIKDDAFKGLRDDKVDGLACHYMRRWIAKAKSSLTVNHHPGTAAARNKLKGNLKAPPDGEDTSGGSIFCDRGDQFISFHRYKNDPEKSNVLELHIRKIKSKRTGGRETFEEYPFKMVIDSDSCGYHCERTGVSPIRGRLFGKGAKVELKQNNNEIFKQNDGANEYQPEIGYDK